MSNAKTFVKVPPVFTHYDVKPVIDVYGSVDGRDLGGVLKDLKPIVANAEKHLTPGNSIVMRGQVKTMHDSYLGLGAGLVTVTTTNRLQLSKRLPCGQNCGQPYVSWRKRPT